MIDRHRHWTDFVRSPAFLGLLALTLLFGGASPALAGGGSGGSGGGSFTLGEDATAPGFLVRGGLSTCPDSFNCEPNPGHEPRYHSCGFSSCGYTNAFVIVTPIDGFRGWVTLEVIDLPPGVTSGIVPKVFVKKDRRVVTDFVLEASTSAPLGDFVITLRGTSGSLVDTKTWVIRIVDELPPPSTI